MILISCDSSENGNEDDNQNENDLTVDNTISETEPVIPALDQQVTPVSDVEEVTDSDAAKSIIDSLSETNDLEIDSENKGVNLILKHDNELKSVALEYSFVDWIAKQTKPVIVEFVADYSEPSVKSLPYLNGIADHYSDSAIVVLVDIEEAPSFVDIFEIEYLPTYFVSKDLTLYVVETSFNPKADPSLFDKIEQILNQ